MWRWPRVRETRSRGCRRVRFAAAKCKERETNAMNVPIPLQDTGRQLDFKLTTYVLPSGLQLSNLGWVVLRMLVFSPAQCCADSGLLNLFVRMIAAPGHRFLEAQCSWRTSLSSHIFRHFTYAGFLFLLRPEILLLVGTSGVRNTAM